MSALQSSTDAKLRINMHLFGAALAGTIAWVIWPDTKEWWGLGLIAVLLWANVIGLTLRALKEIITLYGRDKEIAELASQGEAIKSDHLANEELLYSKGMLDD